jgi:hypothetical protein
LDETKPPGEDLAELKRPLQRLFVMRAKEVQELQRWSSNRVFARSPTERERDGINISRLASANVPFIGSLIGEGAHWYFPWSPVIVAGPQDSAFDWPPGRSNSWQRWKRIFSGLDRERYFEGVLALRIKGPARWVAF